MINDNTLLVGSDYQQIFIVDINQSKSSVLFPFHNVSYTSSKEDTYLFCGRIKKDEQ